MTADPVLHCPIDRGWWTLPSGQRLLLTWHPHTGLLMLGPHPVAHITSPLDLERRLAGWADHALSKDGLAWLAQRLQGCR